MGPASRDPAPDPAAKPIVLCLVGPGPLGEWIARLSDLRAFVVLEARGLPSAQEMARSCRPDLVVMGAGDARGLSGGELAGFAASPLGRLPVILLEGPGEAPWQVPPELPTVEDVLPAGLPAAQAAIRLRAVLRRRRPTALTTRVRWDAIDLRQDERTVWASGRKVALTYHEFNLLALLLERPGAPWPREELRRAMWGLRHPSGPGALNRLAQSVRRRLAPAIGRDPIEAVRGTGYRLR